MKEVFVMEKNMEKVNLHGKIKVIIKDLGLMI